MRVRSRRTSSEIARRAGRCSGLQRDGKRFRDIVWRRRGGADRGNARHQKETAALGPATARATRWRKCTQLIKRNKTTLVFVNTRSQAEMLFQDFWRMNGTASRSRCISGSLDVAQRRKVRGRDVGRQLRGVVCTSSLDLGVDWGDVDLVIMSVRQGASRLMQRIGRANHRNRRKLRAPCWYRPTGLRCWNARSRSTYADNAQDKPPLRTGALDVLAQHVLGCACGEPFLSDELYQEVLTAACYSGLTRKDFDDVVDFVATGGYCAEEL